MALVAIHKIKNIDLSCHFTNCFRISEFGIYYPNRRTISNISDILVLTGYQQIHYIYPIFTQ